MFQRFFDSEEDGLGREEPLLDSDRFGEGITALQSRGGHQTQQRAPIHRSAARKMPRPGVQQAQVVGRDQHKSDLIQPATARPAEHLQDFIGAKGLFGRVAPVGIPRQSNAAEGKVNPGGQAHRRHDNSELARLGQGFDHTGADGIAQSAVMIGDAALEQFCQMLVHDELLFHRQLKRVGRRQLAGEIGRHLFPQ